MELRTNPIKAFQSSPTTGFLKHELLKISAKASGGCLDLTACAKLPQSFSAASFYGHNQKLLGGFLTFQGCVKATIVGNGWMGKAVLRARFLAKPS